MKNITRRSFLRTSFIGAAGLSVVPFLKGCGVAPSDQIRVGVIGLGRQSRGLINGFMAHPNVKVVTGADVFGRKRERFELQVRELQKEKEQSVDVTTTVNYQDILEREDIDIVIICSPDHWHAFQAIDACKAGKDIYLEKPVTLTIPEGRALSTAAKANNVVIGVGSQQRSDHNFQHAVQLIRDNRLGQLTKVHAWVGNPSIPYNLEEEPIPEDLNWDKWLGPNQFVHYNNELAPAISLDPVENESFWAGWRWYNETGGGNLTDWGAHNFDIVQWALDKDDSGPVEIIPAGHGENEYIHFVYEDGLIMANEPFTEDEQFGVRFESSDAWIEVHRGQFRASDDELLPSEPEPQAVEPEYENVRPHLADFLRSVRSRTDTIAPIEAGHRTGTIGILGNIATQLNRPLRWDPRNEQFVDDQEADRRLHRHYRDGYRL